MTECILTTPHERREIRIPQDRVPFNNNYATELINHTYQSNSSAMKKLSKNSLAMEKNSPGYREAKKVKSIQLHGEAKEKQSKNSPARDKQ